MTETGCNCLFNLQPITLDTISDPLISECTYNEKFLPLQLEFDEFLHTQLFHFLLQSDEMAGRRVRFVLLSGIKTKVTHKHQTLQQLVHVINN